MGKDVGNAWHVSEHKAAMQHRFGDAWQDLLPGRKEQSKRNFTTCEFRPWKKPFRRLRHKTPAEEVVFDPTDMVTTTEYKINGPHTPMKLAKHVHTELRTTTELVQTLLQQWPLPRTSPLGNTLRAIQTSVHKASKSAASLDVLLQDQAAKPKKQLPAVCLDNLRRGRLQRQANIAASAVRSSASDNRCL